MTLQLVTTGDIARRLGIKSTAVSNWGTRRYQPVPEPHAVTTGGIRLWTVEQADAMVTEYQRKQQVKKQKKEDRERAARALAALTGGTP